MSERKKKPKPLKVVLRICREQGAPTWLYLEVRHPGAGSEGLMHGELRSSELIEAVCDVARRAGVEIEEEVQPVMRVVAEEKQGELFAKGTP